MALKAVLDSIEGVENAQLYKQVEINGNPAYVLDVEPHNGYALEDVTGLKSALERTTGDLRASKSALSGFKDLDAETVRNSLAELEQLRKGGTDDEKLKQQLESTKQQLTRKHKQELETEQAHSQRYLSALDENLRKQVAIQAISEAGGNPTLLLPHILSQTKMRDDNGQFVVDVIGNDGYARIKDANSAMGIGDLVAEMRANSTFAPAFAGTNKSGSGSQPNGRVATPTKLDEKSTLEDKMAFHKSKLQK